MNFRYRLFNWLQGRHGIDALFYVLFGLAMVLAFLNCFLHLWVIQVVVYVLGLVALVRAFAPRSEARRRENEMAMGWISRLRRKAAVAKERRNDPYYAYKKCPSCHAVLRLPKQPGKHTTVCPRCKKSFSVRI